MKSLVALLILFACWVNAIAQTATIVGHLHDETLMPVPFANAILYRTADSILVKAGITNELGFYQLNDISEGSYFLELSSLGYFSLQINIIGFEENQKIDLGTQYLKPSLLELNEVTVSVSRPVIKIKEDRTIFNVEGTVNSIGSDVISLLRKAPGVTVDNNNTISLLGRSGVLLYIDGKRLPLTGNALSNYLQNLSSEQIDRIDIITNPDVSYDAEGNAGIIDVRLKKDKNIGINGTIQSTYSQGKYSRNNIGASGNYRNKKLNIFTSLGASENTSFNESEFDNYQNGLRLLETNNFKRNWNDYNFRLGTDIFLTSQHTLGILMSANKGASDQNLPSKIQISNQITPNQIDSLLLVKGLVDTKSTQQTYNLNYVFENEKGQRFNIDLDYGSYRNESERLQPNQYFSAENELLLEVTNQISASRDINIYTAKFDYEVNAWGGGLGIGSKLSRIDTDNSYLFFDEANGVFTQNNTRSRLFKYGENVCASYVNYSRAINSKWNLSLGLRAEQTKANGNLHAFVPELDEPPVNLSYFNWFPSMGLTWQTNENNKLSFNYGRRINRPDYLVLNPFIDQITQLSFEKGNPFLRPEIVNNFEIGYSYTPNYNFKISYSRTNDKITRLVGPDANDPRATFSTYENLTNQTTIGFNANASLSPTHWLKTYVNFSASYIDNQADFGNAAIIDLQVFSHKGYLQNTIQLPNDFKADISGYYNGPSIFGGVFETENNWSVDLGLQRKFFNDELNVRLVGNDIFRTSGFDGFAEFDGLRYFGSGRRDSRRVSLNLSYNFGNQNLKSRKRKQGLENEQKRVQ